MLLCQVDSFGDVGSATAQADGERWVRTVDGWEQPSSWEVDKPARRDLHPLVVAAAQGLFSMLGLIAFSRGGIGQRSLCTGVCCHTVF